MKKIDPKKIEPKTLEPKTNHAGKLLQTLAPPPIAKRWNGLAIGTFMILSGLVAFAIGIAFLSLFGCVPADLVGAFPDASAESSPAPFPETGDPGASGRPDPCSASECDDDREKRKKGDPDERREKDENDRDRAKRFENSTLFGGR